GSSSIAELTLIANGLNNSAAGASSTLAATHIELQGRGDSTLAAPAAPGQGTLSFAATDIDLTKGSLAIDGFAQAAFNASDGFVGRDSGSLLVGGDLSVSGARISAGAGSDRAIAATGLTQLASSGTVRASDLPPLELGGSLTFRSASIQDSAAIVAPSGIV